MAVSWASDLLPPLLSLPWQGLRLTEWASYGRDIAQFIDVKLEVVRVFPIFESSLPRLWGGFFAPLVSGVPRCYGPMRNLRQGHFRASPSFYPSIPEFKQLYFVYSANEELDVDL